MTRSSCFGPKTVLFIAAAAALLLGVLLGGCASGHTGTTVVWDTGYTTSSSTPPSITALASGISADQVTQLLGSYWHIPPDVIQVFAHETLGDWAVARIYSRVFANQYPEGRWGVVFQKKNEAWFFKGQVSLVYGRDAAIELRNMDAPEQVWSYFGRSPAELKETTTSSPPGTTPFVALCRHFIDIMGLEKLADTLPLSVMTLRELEWLRGRDMPVRVTDVQGYRLANGDLVILFFIQREPLDTIYRLSDTLDPLAKKQYGAAAVIRFFDETFGYVIVSDMYRYRLESLVQTDRQGLPLDY